MMVFISIMLVLICIVLDQITKSYAIYSLARVKKKKTQGTRDEELKENAETNKQAFFDFALVKNKGAFRGLFKKTPILLIGVQVTGIVVIGILLLIQTIIKKDKLLMVGLSFIFGGAIGNLIDRLRDGYVTDFFAIRWTKNLYYNLADWFIFIGALITFLRSKNL